MKRKIRQTVIALAVLYGCQSNPDTSNGSLADATDATAENEIKQLIKNAFDTLFSNLDTASFNTYCTEDFLLLEDGKAMNADSVKWFLASVIKPQIEQLRSQHQRVERINAFDFIETSVSGNTAWVAYRNDARIVIDGKEVNTFHWLESAVLIKTGVGWKIQLLHSSVLEEAPGNPGSNSN